MAVQAESTSSSFDTVKLVLAIGLLVLGVVGFYYFSAYAPLYRVLGILADVGIAAAIVFTTPLGKSVWSFVKESKVEVRKVIWPTRQETVQATLVVVALVFVVGLFLWLLDMLLFWGVGILTGQKV